MSILGTLGPLVRGSSRRRFRVLPTFPLAFIGGSVVTFATVGIVSGFSGLHAWPLETRQALVGVGFLGLAVIDGVGLRRGSYCPLGGRRQTPKTLLRRFPLGVVSTVWGFDLGLGVTTFRVTALMWAGLLLVALGFCPWWVGLGYGLGFAIPFSTLLSSHATGRLARSRTPVDPGLERMLRHRSTVQAVSIGLLGSCGLGTLAAILVSG